MRSIGPRKSFSCRIFVLRTFGTALPPNEQFIRNWLSPSGRCLEWPELWLNKRTKSKEGCMTFKTSTASSNWRTLCLAVAFLIFAVLEETRKGDLLKATCFLFAIPLTILLSHSLQIDFNYNLGCNLANQSMLSAYRWRYHGSACFIFRKQSPFAVRTDPYLS